MDTPRIDPTDFDPSSALQEGQTLLRSGEVLRARDILISAAHAGQVQARTELPGILRFLGETGSARSALQDLEQEAPLRVHLERGILDMLEGRIQRAHDLFQAVWHHHTHLPDQALQARTALLLAYTSALLGRDAAAHHYLDLAFSLAEAPDRIWALHVQARMATDCGQYPTALAALNAAAALLPHAMIARANHHLEWALLFSALGQWPRAEQACRYARTQAHTTGEIHTESLAAIQHGAVLTALEQWTDAHAALRRAECLCPNSYHRAMIDLRLGALAAAQGQAQGTELLWRARDTLSGLGLLRETAACDLHLAQAALPNESVALQALDRALHARHALNRPCLLPELRFTPHLLPLLTRSAHPAARALHADRQATHPGEPLLVELRTLGHSGVFVDGTEVRLGMRRTPELLSFLLLRGPATRAQVLSALWPDDNPRRAANYFHQAKRELARHAPWLQVRLDRERGTYRLACEGPAFQCDLHVIQRVLSSGDDHEIAQIIRTGAASFLPEADTPWVREERAAVEWTVMKSALGLMQRWSERGEYQKCADLAARLLELDPCDEALVEHLVTATLELEGRASAQRALYAAAQRAQLELGFEPHWQALLARRLNSPAN